MSCHHDIYNGEALLTAKVKGQRDNKGGTVMIVALIGVRLVDTHVI